MPRPSSLSKIGASGVARSGRFGLGYFTGLQAFVFLLAWVRLGVRRVAAAAASVVVVECVFGLVAAFAVGEPVLTFVVSVHWLAVAGDADDLAPVWSGVSGAH